MPRRSCSQPSSEVRQRIATRTSWSSVRRGVCAWTSPVATVSTPRCSARSRERVCRRASPRSNGRCSSTKKRSRPNAAASRAAAFGSRSPSPWRAQPERQTSPSFSSATVSSATHGGSGSRSSRPGRRVPACAAVRIRQRFAYPLLALAEQRHVRAALERDLRAGDRPQPDVLRRMRELERAVDAVVVGQRERLVAELRRPRGELLGMRRAVEERVRRVAVQLDV